MSGQYNRKDRLYQKAKDEGYRSRAAYKLLELNQRHGIIKPGYAVLDLGAWPGGWLQVASNLVGQNGKVVGIDLVAIDELPYPNVVTITGDARDDTNIQEAIKVAGAKFDTVLSDMSPKLTGISEVDQAGIVGCAELALYVAGQVLKKGGNLVIKVFKGNDTEQFIRGARSSFDRLVRIELDATRKSSNEFYAVGLGFKS